MENPIYIVQAAKAIAAKAQRLSSSAATAKRNGPEIERQAKALQAIADAVTHEQPSLSTWVGAVQASNEGAITLADLQRAATEIYSLATRKESKSTVSEADLPSGPGWEPGCDGFGSYIHRDTLQQAIDLYALATTLHNEEYWTYMKGLLLDRIGNYAAAVEAFDSLQGPYAEFGAQQSRQCRKKMAGTYDAKSEMSDQLNNLFGKVEEQYKSSDNSSDLLGGLKNFLDQFNLAQEPAQQERVASLDHERGAADKDKENALASDASDDSRLEQATLTAQMFAEHLASGDYAAAHNLLYAPLKEEASVKVLEQQYRQMVECEGDEEPEVEICVMSSESDMPEMTAEDLGWVYVAISGDGFSEAVTVIVTEENGQARIRELEWGRP